MPSKKDWTFTEAEQALNCEKEYNKRHKNQSLIIKFPDLELNKEIVSKFHNSIENVHFQQPSTARFCFVTLEVYFKMNDLIVIRSVFLVVSCETNDNLFQFERPMPLLFSIFGKRHEKMPIALRLITIDPIFTFLIKSKILG